MTSCHVEDELRMAPPPVRRTHGKQPPPRCCYNATILPATCPCHHDDHGELPPGKPIPPSHPSNYREGQHRGGVILRVAHICPFLSELARLDGLVGKSECDCRRLVVVLSLPRHFGLSSLIISYYSSIYSRERLAQLGVSMSSHYCRPLTYCR
jgi:hypothetical protein